MKTVSGGESNEDQWDWRLFLWLLCPGFGGNQARASSPLTSRANSDQVTLSKQVLAVVQMQNRIRALAQAREDAKNSPEAQALDSMRKAMKVQKTCNKIAARIRAGDHVPHEDLRYLMKHDAAGVSDGYGHLRKPKKIPRNGTVLIPKESKKRTAGSCCRRTTRWSTGFLGL